ncbi:TPA: YggT family protein [Streptococcus suis]
MWLLVQILLKAIDVYASILLIYALMTWFPALVQSRIGQLIRWLVEPILIPFRRLNLQFGGFDFTILLAYLSLQILSRILIGLVIL